jgi:hypothetical protein
MKKIFFLCILLVTLIMILPEFAHAIPAFARKHGFNCNMCHTAYPKLNDFGQRFRDNGYQLPGQEGKEKSIFSTPPPIALRVLPGHMVYRSQCCTTAGFNIYGLDLLAGGVFHENVSFLLIYTPRIDTPAADYTGPNDGNNPSQLAVIESANVVFSNIFKNKLNIRIGRFEPSYLPFSGKRSYFIFSPYEIYDFATPGNSYSLGENQIGIEATGHFKSGFKYGFGIINGNNGEPDNNVFKDIYCNVSKTFGRGDGQSAGQRIGAFLVYGWQPTDFTGSFLSPYGETNGKNNKPYYRVGAAASFNWYTLNIQLLYMRGSDDKALNLVNLAEKYTYDGGFAEIDWAVLKNNRLVLSILYNWVDAPSFDRQKGLKAFSFLGRYYVGNWEAINVALHLEYSRKKYNDCKLKEDLFATVLDFAF